MIDLYFFKTVKGETIFLDVNKIITVFKSSYDTFVIQYGINNSVEFDLQEFSKLAKVVNFVDPEPIDFKRDFEKEKREAFRDIAQNTLKNMGYKQ